MRIPRLILATVGVAILAGCAGGPSVRTNVDAAADFGAYRTYGFVAQPGTDRGEYATLVTRVLKAAVAAEFEKRGYHPSETPDLLVNFQGHSEDKQSVDGMVVGADFRRGLGWGLGGRYGGEFSCYRDVRDVTQGTLNIDVIDRNRKATVWEGTLARELTSDEKKDLIKSLPALAGSVLKAYPYVAGQTAPVVPAK